MDALVARLEAVTARLEAQAGGAPVAPAPPASAPAAPGAVPASVSAFGALLSGPVAKLATLAKPLGDDISAATELFREAFEREAAVLAAVAACAKPAPETLQSLLTPVGEQMMAVGAASEGKRTDAFNHQKALAEAVQGLSFVAYMGPDMGMSLPAAHVNEAWQSAEFWTNKILKEHRAASPEHVAWVAALKALMQEGLGPYVKEHHTTGPSWNAKGADAKTWKPTAATAAIFSDVLATCELVNCRSVQVQCLGSVPTVSIDKVDGCQVFLGEKSFGAAVLTAKSSEVNVVCVPNEGADDEPQETPVPEQFVTTRGADGKWTTVPFTGH